MSATLADAIERLVGKRPTDIRRFAGGDISGASLVTFADGETIVAKSGPVVGIEARMLGAMAQSGAPTPEVIAADEVVMLIEHLPSDAGLSGSAWNSLAEALGQLHADTGESYGWPEDYALRDVTVENTACDSWPQFWEERRLLCHTPHLPAALARRLENLSSKLSDILPHSPKPALLHGDLWGGNILVSGGRISGLIDPCAYYGDREADAASLTVFDHPPGSFFASLEMEPGWSERQPVYRLWMWLLHVRLFGDGYRPAVERELEMLGF